MEVPLNEYTKEFLDSLDPQVRRVALKRYHNWMKEKRLAEREKTRRQREELWRLRKERKIPEKTENLWK